jgi:NNP family nitrate/nitrite transporter-like MFS transporter
MAYTLAPASLVTLFTERFAIDKSAAGLAISAVYLTWTLLQLPGGWLMDRYDNRRLVLGAVAVFLVTAVAGMFAPGYGSFLVTRLVGGVTAVFIWTASLNVVAQVFPPERRALGTSLFVTSGPVGIALAQFAGPLIAGAYGWRAVFAAYPLVTLVGALALAAALRHPVRNESQLSLSGFLASLRTRSVLWVGLSSFCAFSLLLFFSSWMPTYGTEVLSLDLSTAGAMAALVSLAGLLARPGGGWLSDRIGQRHRLVTGGALVATIPVVVGVTQVSSPAGFALVLALAGFTSQLGMGIYPAFATDLAAADSAGTSLAVVTTFSVGGGLVAPVVTGWLVETLSWTAGFGFAVAAAVAGAATVALVDRS